MDARNLVDPWTVLKGLKRPDVILALGISAVVAMIIVPLPNLILDALIAVNIALCLTILLVTMFAKNALELSAFPSILLMTTLFRLGLNVSTTRGILARADAGEVVRGFGTFVLQGDVVVGGVIFLVITLVQFMVVGKGAERVAEVSARFTLDAMPGKQMSIDAALRQGSIDEVEAQAKRDELSRHSQMFGNMDGAMKFVKGDAIAGLVITALNLIAGLSIGIVRLDLTADAAIDTYSKLTIGDGLVSQIPALLVTLAAGVLVTRVETKDKTKNLGYSLKDELLSKNRPLFIGAALMIVLGLVPGLPFIPFALCAAATFGCAVWSKLMGMLRGGGTYFDASVPDAAVFTQEVERRTEEAKAQKGITDQIAPSVVPITIDLETSLGERLGFGGGYDDESTELIRTYIPQLRDALYLETGVRFPGVRVRTECDDLPKNTFVVRINDVPVAKETVPDGMCLAVAPPKRLESLGLEAKPIVHPVNKAKISLVEVEAASMVEASGISVWKDAGIVALYTASVLRAKAKDFINIQEVSEIIERLEKAYPALVKEVVPKVATIPQLVGVLRRLVEEGVCIRNMKGIIEAIGEFGERDGDVLFLTERARAALGAQLAHGVCGMANQLPVLLLDPEIEETISSAIVSTSTGQTLVLDPEVTRHFVVAIAKALQPVVARGKRPVILTHAEVRRFVRKIVEFDLPDVQVLSFDELPAELTIQPLGRAMLDDDAGQLAA